jgi:hypothetical protein
MNLILWPFRSWRTRGCVTAISVAVLLGACAAERVPKCRRIDAPSMGPENAFRISIPAESAPVLAGETDRVEVAFTIVPPVEGPVTLVHSLEGGDTTRWELKVGAAAGISTRCRLGATRALSTCDSSIGNLPLSFAGQWSVEPGKNRLLEAGLGVRTCR